MQDFDWAEAVAVVGVAWALAFGARAYWRRKNVADKDIFAQALAEQPARAAALSAAVATLAAQHVPPLAVIPGLVEQCWGSSDSLSDRMWPVWAAAQWGNYAKLYPEWMTMTLEGFVAERSSVKEVGQNEQYRYPGDLTVTVVPTVVFTATINGKAVVFDSLDDMERELFTAYQTAQGA
jgi:hypothetical protein